MQHPLVDTKNFTKYLNRHEIDAAVQYLANHLNQEYDGKEVILVGELKGSFMFLSDLLRRLTFNPEVEFVRLTRHGKTASSGGTHSLSKDIQADLKDKHVLIVEQIIDSGRALKFLYDRLRLATPLSVEVVTLLDKPGKRVVDVPVKYVGREIEDQFLIGYGLDLEEKSRNLPEIYYLKYPN